MDEEENGVAERVPLTASGKLAAMTRDAPAEEEDGFWPIGVYHAEKLIMCNVKIFNLAISKYVCAFIA